MLCEHLIGILFNSATIKCSFLQHIHSIFTLLPLSTSPFPRATSLECVVFLYIGYSDRTHDKGESRSSSADCQVKRQGQSLDIKVRNGLDTVHQSIRSLSSWPESDHRFDLFVSEAFRRQEGERVTVADEGDWTQRARIEGGAKWSISWN